MTEEEVADALEEAINQVNEANQRVLDSLGFLDGIAGSTRVAIMVQMVRGVEQANEATGAWGEAIKLIDGVMS